MAQIPPFEVTPKKSPPSPASTVLASGCGCAFVLPIAVLALGVIYSIFDKTCGTPGDSGGCAMGIASAAIAAIIPGAILGLVVGLGIVAFEYWKKRKKAEGE
jgi:hypothetical protein